MGKTERDLIGRWLPEGSDQYLTTYNAALERLRKKFVEMVRSGKAYSTFDEGSVLEEIKEWMVSHWEAKVRPVNVQWRHSRTGSRCLQLSR